MSRNKTPMMLKEITERVFETWAKFIQYILVAVPLLDSIAVFRIYASLLVTTGFVLFPPPPPPHTIPLGLPSAPAPSIQHRALNLDWHLISYMSFHMFQCHSPKSSHPLPQSP